MSERSLGRRSVLALASIVVVVDQVSKSWMTAALAEGNTIKAVPGLLDFKLVHNTGAAFSLLTGSTLLLGVLSLAVAVGVMIWMWKQRRRAPTCYWKRSVRCRWCNQDSRWIFRWKRWTH